MKTNQEYKNSALATLKGLWAYAVLVTAVYLAISLLCSSGSSASSFLDSLQAAMPWFAGGSAILSLFVTSPLLVGFDNAFLALYRRSDTNMVENMFKFGFQDYTRTVWTMLLRGIKVLLWSLLLLVPGIIKSFAYAMTPYILRDCPELSASEAIKKSEEMMKGHKFDLFYLYLSFIGWFILAIITAGIGFLWLVPYVQASEAAFYEDLKGTDPIIVEI